MREFTYENVLGNVMTERSPKKEKDLVSQIKRCRRLDFDVIRIFACLTILIIHFNASVSGYDYSGTFLYSNGLIPNYYFKCVYLGEIGNGLFFILSGASLVLSNSSLELSAKELPQFYWKRIKSLMPQFWIAWIAATFATLILNKGIGSAPAYKALWTLFGMDGYSWARGWCDGSFYQVGEWYLGCALLCYLLWPLVVYLWRKLSFPLFGGVVLAIYISGVALTDGSALSISIRLTQMIIGGCFTRYLKTAKNAKLLGISAIIAAICVLGQQYLHSITVAFAVDWMIFLFLSLLVESFPIFFDMLAPVIIKASALTYPLFLVHHKIISLMAGLFDLEYFPYRNTLVLFAGYIFVAVFLAKVLNNAAKRATQFTVDLWKAIREEIRCKSIE